MTIALLFFVVAAVLAAVAAFVDRAGPVHLGWVAVFFLAMAHALTATL